MRLNGTARFGLTWSGLNALVMAERALDGRVDRSSVYALDAAIPRALALGGKERRATSVGISGDLRGASRPSSHVRRFRHLERH